MKKNKKINERKENIAKKDKIDKQYRKGHTGKQKRN